MPGRAHTTKLFTRQKHMEISHKGNITTRNHIAELAVCKLPSRTGESNDLNDGSQVREMFKTPC